MLRLTKSVCFALEMSRACLQTSPRYANLGMAKIWDDVTNIKVEGRVVTFRVRVHDFPRVVYVKCILALGREDHFDHGECHIEVKSGEPFSDVWLCVANNHGKINSYTGYGLKWLELDDDILAALEATDVLMFTELHELSEVQALEILDNATQSQVATGDMLWRLRKKLDEKNIKLEEPRLSTQALAALALNM